MSSIKILSKYPRIDLNENELVFESEKKWQDRPAWIRVKNAAKPFPRLLSVQVPKYGELIYKSFGHYYFPFDYTNDEERRFMDGMAQDYDNMVGNEFNIPMAKALLSKIPLVEIDQKSAILDLGCGTGIISDILSYEGYTNFTLVDFSEEMLEEAKKKNLKNAKFLHLDLTKKVPEGTYMLVMSVMLFNTFNEKVTSDVITKLLPHLRPNSVFAVLEDTGKKAYKEHFDMIYEGMVDVANRTKYMFVGRLK